MLFVLLMLFRRAFLFGFVLFLMDWSVASAKKEKVPLVHTELSTNLIKINSKFLGEEIMVFGNKNCKDCDIITVLTGGSVRHRVSRLYKNEIGMWFTKDSILFKDVPGVYFLITNKLIDNILDPILQKRLSVGFRLMNMDLIKDGLSSRDYGYVYDARQVIIKDQVYKGLFMQKQLNNEDFVNKRDLFKIEVFIPSNMWPDSYLVKTFLVKDKWIYGVEIDPLVVSRVGASSTISSIAKDSRKVYYLLSVAIAMCFGIVSFLLFDIFEITERVKRFISN
ncbi:TIGR02186 family protein [Rickettsiales bacterium]|nr:TIGR02186 family protein [Rickettsiales bacterium]